jgi:hypothetical protein
MAASEVMRGKSRMPNNPRFPNRQFSRRSGVPSLVAAKSFDSEYETEWDDEFGASVRRLKLLTFREAVLPPPPRKRRAPAKKRVVSRRKKQPKRAN